MTRNPILLYCTAKTRELVRITRDFKPTTNVYRYRNGYNGFFRKILFIFLRTLIAIVSSIVIVKLENITIIGHENIKYNIFRSEWA